MPNKSIRELTRADTLLSSDFLHVSQGGVDKALPADKVLESISDGSPFNYSVFDFTGTTKTLTINDRNTYIRADNTATQTFTISNSVNSSWKINDNLVVRKEGNGDVVFVGESGVTLNPSISGTILTLNGQLMQLVYLGNNTWDLNTGGSDDISIVADYSANGDYYIDTGSADNYILDTVSSNQQITSYKDGMRFRFKALSENTGTVVPVVNVSGLGNKNIKLKDGVDVNAREISDDVTLVYNQSSDYMELQTNSIGVFNTSRLKIGSPTSGVSYTPDPTKDVVELTDLSVNLSKGTYKVDCVINTFSDNPETDFNTIVSFVTDSTMRGVISNGIYRRNNATEGKEIDFSISTFPPSTLLVSDIQSVDIYDFIEVPNRSITSTEFVELSFTAYIQVDTEGSLTPYVILESGGTVTLDRYVTVEKVTPSGNLMS